METRQLLNDEFIENTYLYCYKRLSNREEAQDLAQDIILEALKAIESEKQFYSFQSWYWKMAYNRYCLFLKKKNSGAVLLDVQGGKIISENMPMDEHLITSEEVSSLNAAISVLSSIHREMIVLFYLKEMSINEISQRLNIPTGTVKRRLFDAKQNIKKGVCTMNNIGKFAYAPAELSLWGGYSAPKHWPNISDILTKQIFVACSNRSRTISEIAGDIGVAPVYFEDKIKYLVENRFLKETGNSRYITDFCIFPEQIYHDFYHELSLVYSDIGKEITDTLYDVKEKILSRNFYGNHFEYKYLLWILYVYACQSLGELMLSQYEMKWEGRIPKDNGKEYRIAGRVVMPDEKIEYKTVKSQSWSNLHSYFATGNYKRIEYANLFQQEPFGNREEWLNDKNVSLVMKIYDNACMDLSPVEEEQAAFLISKGLILKKSNGFDLRVPVLKHQCKAAIIEIIKDAVKPLAEKYVNIASDLGDKKLLPLVSRELLEEYAHWIMLGAFFPIDYVFYYAISEQTVEIPDCYENYPGGLCITIYGV